MSDQLRRISEVLRPFCHPQMQRDAASTVIRAIAGQLRADAMQEEFLSDRRSLYVGAEQMEGWLE